MLLSKISIESCMIIYYIVEENVFIVFCLRAFITKEILKRHIKDRFNINRKQTIMIPKKDEYIKFKNFERKIKSPFMVYANFEIILVPEDNGKKNLNERVLY